MPQPQCGCRAHIVVAECLCLAHSALRCGVLSQGIGCAFVFTSHRTDAVDIHAITRAIDSQRLVLIQPTSSWGSTTAESKTPAAAASTTKPDRRHRRGHNGHVNLWPKHRQSPGHSTAGTNGHTSPTAAAVGLTGQSVLQSALGRSAPASAPPGHLARQQGKARRARPLRVQVHAQHGRLGLSLLEQALTPNEGLHTVPFAADLAPAVAHGSVPQPRGNHTLRASRTVRGTHAGGDKSHSPGGDAGATADKRRATTRPGQPAGRLRHGNGYGRSASSGHGDSIRVGGRDSVSSAGSTGRGRRREDKEAAAAVRDANRAASDAARRRREGQLAAYKRMAYAYA